MLDITAHLPTHIPKPKVWLMSLRGIFAPNIQYYALMFSIFLRLNGIYGSILLKNLNKMESGFAERS